MGPAAKRLREVAGVRAGVVMPRLVRRPWRTFLLNGWPLVTARLILTLMIIVSHGPIGRDLGRCIGLPVLRGPRVYIEDCIVLIVLRLFHCCVHPGSGVTDWQRACLGAAHEVALALEHGLVPVLRLRVFLLRARVAPLLETMLAKRWVQGWEARVLMREARGKARGEAREARMLSSLQLVVHDGPVWLLCGSPILNRNHARNIQLIFLLGSRVDCNVDLIHFYRVE